AMIHSSATPGQTQSAKPSDIRIEDIFHSYQEFRYRTPMKFGGQVIDRATILNVSCVVRTRDGRQAKGFGSMPLGNPWAFPSKRISHDRTLAAMEALADEVAGITADYKEPGHPIDLNCALEPIYLKAAADLSKRLELAEPIPVLAILVAASPFDAALHDAFGKAHRRSCYETYSPEFMRYDLGHYLGDEFRSEALDRYVTKSPKECMPVFHLVGAMDPIDASDVRKRIGDGLPETLAEWIRSSGLTHLKIKLNGDDLDWDVERVVRVDRIAEEAGRQRRAGRWSYSLDFNERCASVKYLLDFLDHVKEKTPHGFERIQYIEQP